MPATNTELTPDQVRELPTRDLKAIIFSTNPKGRFAEHLKVAKEELTRRWLAMVEA